MNKDTKIATRQSFGEALKDLGEKNESIVVLDADLSGATKTNIFAKAFPERFFDMGIAEQNMCSVAAALGIENKKPYLYSIGNFDTLRCLEQIRNNILYHNSNTKIISVGSGFGYGPMGVTHHATEDLGIMRCLPGLTIFTPSDPEEARQIAHITTINAITSCTFKFLCVFIAYQIPPKAFFHESIKFLFFSLSSSISNLFLPSSIIFSLSSLF